MMGVNSRNMGLYRASVPVQYSYTSTPPIGRTACTEPQCLYCTAIPLLPYWPYSLYRASMPVQYSYTSTTLSACTVQLYLYSLSICTVQLYLYSLSACTTVHIILLALTTYTTKQPFITPTCCSVQKW